MQRTCFVIFCKGSRLLLSQTENRETRMFPFPAPSERWRSVLVGCDPDIPPSSCPQYQALGRVEFGPQLLPLGLQRRLSAAAAPRPAQLLLLERLLLGQLCPKGLVGIRLLLQLPDRTERQREKKMQSLTAVIQSCREARGVTKLV